jgi:dTDP-4-amino-4,6-dideoxygalactose transaminase
MSEIISLGQPTVGEEEVAAVAEVLRSGWLAGQGPTARAFEERFAARCGTTHALAVANCTAALHLVFDALGANDGDEVVVADYTFPATGHAVMYTRARPVFADVRPDIWTVDPQAVEAAITSRTVGIAAVDAFGQPADYDDLPVPVFDGLGYNYKLSEIAAAVISVQLDRLTALVDARRAVARRYAELLGDVDEITLPVELADRETVWQSYVLTLDPGVDRGAMAAGLRARGVQCTIGTYASHLQPIYGTTSPCPVSADVFRRHLAIPMHANLTDGQVETVAKSVLEAVRARR